MNCIGLAVATLLVLVSLGSARGETIRIAIEDKNWSPYYVWVEGEPHGPCPEIARGALQLMGIEVEYVPLSWVRVLADVEKQKVDAGLCGTKNSERAAYSYYPDEPLLTYDATLFVNADSPIQGLNMAELKGKTFGLIKGYTYGDVDRTLEEQGMVRSEVNDRGTLIKLLAKGRLDTMLDSVLPVFADARKLGVHAQIRPLYPSLSETPGYLFFSQRPGHEDLAMRFSAALKDFKTTDTYQTIRERYGF